MFRMHALNADQTTINHIFYMMKQYVFIYAGCGVLLSLSLCVLCIA